MALGHALLPHNHIHEKIDIKVFDVWRWFNFE